MDEFKNFRNYIKEIEKGYDGGICKIIPPEGWFEGDYSDEVLAKIKIKQFYSQVLHTHGTHGIYSVELKGTQTGGYTQNDRLGGLSLLEQGGDILWFCIS
tara:strand:- start:131 stop:430 length:300 start_codon:yes stop_codon:yes gene_type:complete